MLSILGYTAGSDHLYFGTVTGAGIDSVQLGQISFYSGGSVGSGFLGTGKARGLVLPEAHAMASRAMLTIPLLGSIAARFAVEAKQSSEGCITVDADTLHLPRNARTFALKVRGDSMNGINIVDGDNVILEFRDPKHGDVVAALIDGETTLKRYVIRKGRPYLRAENPNYPDLIPARELVVQGVMVALLRVPQEKKR